MEKLLLFLVLGLFVAMVFVNVYFRFKVLKHYNVLNKAGIPFSTSHVFNEEKMQTEIISKYPGYEVDLLGFSRHLRFSIKMASVLIILITLFGAVLMFYR